MTCPGIEPDAGSRAIVIAIEPSDVARDRDRRPKGIRGAASSVTISAENVENVVSPPRKPVVTSSRASGGITAWRVMSSIAKPISRPPTGWRRACRSGSVGNTGFSSVPSPQRSHAPTAAPPPTARIPLQGMRSSLAQRTSAATRQYRTRRSRPQRGTQLRSVAVSRSRTSARRSSASRDVAARRSRTPCSASAAMPLAATDADAERRRREHQPVVAAVADRHDVLRAERFDEALLGLGLVVPRQHDRAAQSNSATALADVPNVSPVMTWQRSWSASAAGARAHVASSDAIQRQRAVVVADEIGELELPESRNRDLDHRAIELRRRSCAPSPHAA